MELLIKREYPKHEPVESDYHVTNIGSRFYNRIHKSWELETGEVIKWFQEPISVEEVSKEQVINELENLSNEISSIEYKYRMFDNVLLGIRRAKIEITARLNQLKSAK